MLKTREKKTINSLKSIVTYGAQNMEINRILESKLMSLKWTFCGDRRDVQDQTKLDIMLLEKMYIKNYILDYIRYKQLNWYGHVQRMNEERLPRNLWMQEVTTGMREMVINKMDWIDREK